MPTYEYKGPFLKSCSLDGQIFELTYQVINAGTRETVSSTVLRGDLKELVLKVAVAHQHASQALARLQNKIHQEHIAPEKDRSEDRAGQ
jgi:hypothetical protein